MMILNKINNHLRHILLVVAIFIGSLAFGQKKLGKGDLPEHTRLEFEKEFFKAAKEKMLGDYPEAIEDFRKAAEINPYDANTQFQLSQLYLATKKVKEAEDAAQKAIGLDSKNFWYKTQLAEVYKNQKRFTEAAKLNVLIYETGGKNPQNLYDAVLLFTLDKKYADAIKTLDKIEKQTGLNEEIVKQKEQIYLLSNKLKKAIKEVERLVNAHPNELRYKGMLADLLMANGRIKEALDIYNKILEQDSKNGFALFAMADYYNSKSEYEPYFNYLKRAMASNVDIKSKIQEMADFVTDNKVPEGTKKSFELSDILIASNPSEPIAYMMKGDLFIKEKNYEQARLQFLQATHADPNAYAAWEQIMYCDDELKNNQYMQSDCEKAVEIFPTQPRFFCLFSFCKF
jgi:tetratricopeptide (TPR) repeat protein